MKILFIESGLRGDASISAQMAARFKAALRVAPEVVITTRHVAEDPLPALDTEMLAALWGDQAQRTEQQQHLVDISDTLIAELKDADVVVIAASMYNFGMPSQLKTYFDLVLRAGATFQYLPDGPQGLLPCKRGIILAATGGVFSAGAGVTRDFMVPNITHLLQFMGIADVAVVRAEWQAFGPEVAELSLEKAFSDLDQLACDLAA